MTRWALSGTVTATVGGAITGAVVALVDGPDAGRQTTTDVSGRFTLSDLQQAGFSLRITANGYREAARAITLTSNAVADVQLLPLLALLVDVVGSPIRYERVPGGFEAYATAVNDGPGCANAVGGVTTIRNAAPPNLTLDFSWSLPTDRIIQSGERFDYHLGFMTDAQAFQFPEGSAFTKFSGFSVPCP
jgi:hypothetical protein